MKIRANCVATLASVLLSLYKIYDKIMKLLSYIKFQIKFEMIKFLIYKMILMGFKNLCKVNSGFSCSLFEIVKEFEKESNLKITFVQ